MKYYVLYNPNSDNQHGEEEAKKLEEILSGNEFVYQDVTKVDNYKAFFAGMDAGAEVILCGGDGTLNRFANNIDGLENLPQISFFACGSGNDFLRDVGDNGGKPVPMNAYLTNLPTVTVKGNTYRFINGVGYGIDGYCCEVGDKLREKSPGKKINYTGIAIKGLLFHYKPTGATITIDGKEHRFEKVWLAPAMFGRCYGGGMYPTPGQTREDDHLSVLVFHGSGKLKTLMIFPSIFKGEHVKKEKHVTVLSGKEITVKYDEPRPVQVDGETILDVSEYTARR
ncbi:MAG: diacylglycerol kinase family protein [Clostridia bacterium]|nr:diacylglycerol kinase family protein [Clostridia bacterium]